MEKLLTQNRENGNTSQLHLNLNTLFTPEFKKKKTKPNLYHQKTHHPLRNTDLLKLQGKQVLHFIHSYKKNSTANYML